MTQVIDFLIDYMARLIDMRLFTRLTVLGLFLLFPQGVFAADVEVSGKVLDQMNNPVPNGAIVFANQSGKTVNAATSDLAGLYRATIPQGTYSISVNGPKGTPLMEVSMERVGVTKSTTMDFILKAPESRSAQKPTALRQATPYMIGGVLILIAGLGGYLFTKRKKASA